MFQHLEITEQNKSNKFSHTGYAPCCDPNTTHNNKKLLLWPLFYDSMHEPVLNSFSTISLVTVILSTGCYTDRPKIFLSITWLYVEIFKTYFRRPTAQQQESFSRSNRLQRQSRTDRRSSVLFVLKGIWSDQWNRLFLLILLSVSVGRGWNSTAPIPTHKPMELAWDTSSN